jgi:anti-sigma factor RsiW
MNQSVTEADLQAWHDGRLPADRRAQVEEWLAARPQEAERFQAYRNIEMQMRERFDPILDQSVPPQLAMSLKPKPHRMQRLAAAWLLAVCSAGAGWFGHDALQAAMSGKADMPDDLAHQAAIAHAVFSPEVRHPVEVVAAQKAHLTAWLSKRLDTQLTLPQLDSLGYTLVGGRLLTGNRGAVAQLMYRNESGTRVTLYVSPEYMTKDVRKQSGFASAHIGGLNVVYWSDEHFGCAIAGDLPRQELLRIGHAAYGQLDES